MVARTLLFLTVAASALGLAGCGRSPDSAGSPAPPPKGPPVLVVPQHGAYTGAYINFGDKEDDVTLEGIEEFEEQTGKHQAIVAFSSYWGEQQFPTAQTQIITRHGSVPLIYWSPWDYPYSEELIEVNDGKDKYRLENILGGKCDDYIDRWADGVKALGTPVFVSLCNEMNGNWFPWSASYYGGGRPIAGVQPPKFVGPEYFKRAYRYIVDRVRARGASNVLWVFHVNNFPEPYEDWNGMAQFYPGPDYVDWLGLSVYGQMLTEEKWDSFDDMILKPYTELCRVDPDKPMMVAEWAVGEFPAHGDKGAWITEGFDHIIHRYPRLRAAIYWDERWQNAKTYLYSNMRVNSSPGALAAYRRGVASPFWIGEPIFR